MTKTLLFTFLFFTIVSTAQDKLKFTYDQAGNQTLREICINCPSPSGKQTKTIDEITQDDLITSDVSDQVSYYPNPVIQELYVYWNLVNEKKVTSIQVYTMSGQQLRNYPIKTNSSTLTIFFQNYPSGIYNVVINYDNGERNTLKIVKR